MSLEEIPIIPRSGGGGHGSFKSDDEVGESEELGGGFGEIGWG